MVQGDRRRDERPGFAAQMRRQMASWLMVNHGVRGRIKRRRAKMVQGDRRRDERPGVAAMMRRQMAKWPMINLGANCNLQSWFHALSWSRYEKLEEQSVRRLCPQPGPAWGTAAASAIGVHAPGHGE